MVTETLKCPHKLAGHLIGPKGSVIKRLQRESGAHIQLQGEKVTIRGEKTSVKKACVLVNAIVNPRYVTIEVQPHLVGHIIGPHGVEIKRMQHQSGAHIEIENTIVKISGSDKAIHAAEALIKEVINPQFKEVLCPKNDLGPLIGEGGENFKKLSKACGCRFEIEDVTRVHETVGTCKIKITAIHPNNQVATLKCGVITLEKAIKVATEAMDYAGPQGREFRHQASIAQSREHKFLQDAEEAYAHGLKERAHKLSMEGHKWGKKVDEDNAKAVDAIFHHRNDGKGKFYIDFHGLYVKEAMSCLEKRLNDLGRNNGKVLKAITGAGNHSPGHHAHIKPAVEEYLRTHNYKYKPDTAGAFDVMV